MCLKKYIFAAFVITTLSIIGTTATCDNARKCIYFLRDNLTLQCFNVTDIGLLTLNSCFNVERIIFEGGNITSLRKDNLPRGLKALGFRDHSLIDIADDAFDNVAETLNVLAIINAKFTTIPNALFRLNNLISLIIVGTQIQEYNTTILEHLANKLEQINMTNVGLSSWPSWLYLFHSLYSINLSQNQIENVPDDAFNSSKDTLTIINLAQAGLTNISQAFSILTKLHALNLSGNFIENVDDRPGIEQLVSMPCAKTITILLIESIGLTVLPRLSNMTALDTLKMGYNNISSSENGTLPSSLEYLQLQHNSLTSVPSVVLDVNSLLDLDLSYNKISIIIIDMLPLIIYSLDLSYNQITEITSSTGTTPSTIIILNLQSNPISIISPTAFRLFFMLEELHLDNTHLTEVPIAFKSLDSLRILTITNTSLTCQCPPPLELSNWYRKIHGHFTNNDVCSNGTTLSYYLSSPKCVPGGDDGASNLVFNLSCGYASFLLLLILHLCRF